MLEQFCSQNTQHRGLVGAQVSRGGEIEGKLSHEMVAWASLSFLLQPRLNNFFFFVTHGEAK
jgi:hypothetical protein